MLEAMSFREKSAWICLITTVVVFVPYFAYVFLLFAHRDLSVGSYVGAFIAAVVWQVVLNVGAQIAVSIRSGPEPKDERDVAIEAKAYRNAYIALVSLGWSVPFFSLPFSAALGQTGLPLVKACLVLTSQFLLLSFVVAEALKYLTQVVCYRRGI
jgi:hypothetical protein